MKNSDDDTSPMPRSTCIAGRLVTSTLPPRRISTAGSIMMRNTKKRIQAISTAGKPRVRYLASASEHARNTVEAITSAMPRNGRSVRCGARSAARRGVAGLAGI
jgi:hypothetical protein